MIPPEPDPPGPGPDPPEPVIPEYTYATASSISLSESITGMLYTNIQYNGSACSLAVKYGSTDYNCSDIILYDVGDDHYCYFCYNGYSMHGVLGNNAEIGLTVPWYRIQNGAVTQDGTVSVESSTPSDYFENVRTRNFTLAQRS